MVRALPAFYGQFTDLNRQIIYMFQTQTQTYLWVALPEVTRAGHEAEAPS
jgi:hypothetical protein